MDLSDIQSHISEIIDRNVDNPEKTRQWLVSAYVKIASAVSERKEKQMAGEMLPAKIKPPKPGKKMYRAKRMARVA